MTEPAPAVILRWGRLSLTQREAVVSGSARTKQTVGSLSRLGIVTLAALDSTTGLYNLDLSHHGEDLRRYGIARST